MFSEPFQISVFLLYRDKPEKRQKKRKRKRKRRAKKVDDTKFITTNKCSDEADARCDELETICGTIQTGLFEDEKIEMRFCSVPKEKRDLCYRLLCMFESDLVEDCKSPFNYTDMYAEYISFMYMDGTPIRDEEYELSTAEPQ